FADSTTSRVREKTYVRQGFAPYIQADCKKYLTIGMVAALKVARCTTQTTQAVSSSEVRVND
ncbi:hypothetical protein QMO17_30900, partial [Klebsiella pneumoniae]|nr:hypothetical protein [Klebsiella pneumoniae]